MTSLPSLTLVKVLKVKGKAGFKCGKVLDTLSCPSFPARIEDLLVRSTFQTKHQAISPL